jgi:hypothetical protein
MPTSADIAKPAAAAATADAGVSTPASSIAHEASETTQNDPEYKPDESEEEVEETQSKKDTSQYTGETTCTSRKYKEGTRSTVWMHTELEVIHAFAPLHRQHGRITRAATRQVLSGNNFLLDRLEEFLSDVSEVERVHKLTDTDGMACGMNTSCDQGVKCEVG